MEKKLNAISNDASLTLNAAGNKLTAGYYFNHFTSNDLWSLGNSTWQQVGGSADMVNLNNGTIGAYAIADFGTADENAFYLADSYNITEALRLDAAIRYEVESIKFSVANGSGLDITRHAVPWTVGLDYKATSNLNLYVRGSEGYHIPSFDDVRSQIGNTGPSLDDNWKVLSVEAGVKYHDHSFDAAFDVFWDKVTGAVYNDVGVPPVVAGSKTYGAELSGGWHSSFGLGITGDAVLENPKTWAPGDSYDGNQAERIPKYQARITPEYKFGDADTKATLYSTFEALGQRYSDLQNIQPLPAYQTVSAGVLVEHGGISLQVAGDNLTNSHGLTEGNPRFLTTPGAALPDVRPIFGRSFKFTVGYKF